MSPRPAAPPFASRASEPSVRAVHVTAACGWRETLADVADAQVVHAHGARALRRSLVCLAIVGGSARVVASMLPGDGPSRAGLWRRADLVLAGPGAGDAALEAGVEPARLRSVRGLASPGSMAADAAAAVASAHRDVLASHRLRLAHRRRLEREGRVRRALR